MALVNRHEWHGNVGSDLNLKSGSPEPDVASLSREPNVGVAITPQFADDTSPPQQIISEQTRELEKSVLAPMLARSSVETRPAKHKPTPTPRPHDSKSTQAETMRRLAKLREQHGFRFASEVVYQSVADGPELQLDGGGVVVPELQDVPRSAIPAPRMFCDGAGEVLDIVGEFLRKVG